MKILIMDIMKPLGKDGSTIHRWELARNLAKLGCKVYAISYTDNSSEEGLHICLLPKNKIKYVIQLLKLVTRHRFDIIYTRNIMKGIIGFLIRRLRNSKLVIEVNSISPDEWRFVEKQLSGKIKRCRDIKIKFLKYLEIFVIKKADAVIVVTHGIKNYLVNHKVDENKVWVIGNGANTDLFKPIRDKNILQQLRNRLHINNNEKVILFVGNLAPWQGVEYLIRSAPLIIEEVPKTKFLIVGDGIMREKLESMVRELELEEKFIFTGRVPYEKVPIFINISDVCVCPSPVNSYFRISGGSSLKIFEYLACGKPVVTGNIRGDGDLVVNSGSGFAVMSEDYAELAGAIIKLLKNEKLRLQMGENGRKTIVEYHSWERIAKKVVEIFEKIIREKG